MPNKAAKSRRQRINQGITLKLRCSFLGIPTSHEGPDNKRVHETRNHLRKEVTKITKDDPWPVYLAKAKRVEEYHKFVSMWKGGSIPKDA